MEQLDYLISGGRVVDPARGVDDICDIGVKDGLIVNPQGKEAREVIDARGCLVTPGLIDFHCHIGPASSSLGIPGEATYFPTGVTTVVDAGTSGTSNYLAFRQLTLFSRLRIKAFLNVSPEGLVTTAHHENLDPACYEEKRMLLYLDRYRDQLLGLKIRQSTELVEGRGLDPMKRMLSIAEKAHCPVVVHTTHPPCPVEELARLLRPGDVYAHVYQGKGETVIRNGRVIPEMFSHQERGVLFDAANGVNHFSLDVARSCLEQGFLPDIISTDLSVKSVYAPGKVFSLPYIMSKYLALGMKLPEIIRRVTVHPARFLGEEKNLGSLEEGTCADVTILREVLHPVVFRDFSGAALSGDVLLRTEMTLRDGKTVFRQIEF